MAGIAYDYIVHIQVTRANGQVEDWRHPLQAYGVQEAMIAAMIELDAEHQIAAAGNVIKVLSVRPDIAKIGETTRLMTEQSVEAMKLLRWR